MTAIAPAIESLSLNVTEELRVRSSLATTFAALLEEMGSIQPSSQIALTGLGILELAKQAGSLFRTDDPANKCQWVETVLSNCTFDRGTLCPSYAKPFDLFARANQTGDWRAVWDEFRKWARTTA